MIVISVISYFRHHVTVLMLLRRGHESAATYLAVVIANPPQAVLATVKRQDRCHRNFPVWQMKLYFVS